MFLLCFVSSAAQIGEKIALAESLGSDGQVEECLKIMQEVEDIKLEKQTIDEEYRGIAPVSSQQAQKLRVCEVCSAYLSLYDNDRRLADHFGGKLHLGFVNVREKMKELEEVSCLVFCCETPANSVAVCVYIV